MASYMSKSNAMPRCPNANNTLGESGSPSFELSMKIPQNNCVLYRVHKFDQTSMFWVS